MILDCLEQILGGRDISELERALFDVMGRHGFNNVFYTARFLLTLPSSLTRGDGVLISNLPPEIQRQFGADDMLSQSHWAQWVHLNDGEISSRDLLQETADLPPTRMLHTARRPELEATQIISLRDRVLRSRGALILSPRIGASHDEVAELWDRHGRRIRTLARVFHMRMATMRRETSPVLTPRQREVLEWRSAGKTISEIATILGVTPATIEKHMRLAREALGAETTAQAILKAHVAQELFSDDGSRNPFA